jgi:hypothetical protein
MAVTGAFFNVLTVKSYFSLMEWLLNAVIRAIFV